MKPLNNIKVSIIIPTFGRPKTLKRAIDSVLVQTHKNYEVIVVDDNNPNSEFRSETENLMVQYTNKENIIYIKHEKNKNGAAARNTGIKKSTGSLLCFLDDDDWFLPHKLEIQIEHLLKNIQYQAVYCGWIKNNKKFKNRYSGDLTKELLLMEYEPMTPTLMFRREAIEALNGFDESFRRHQDYELMLRFFEKYKITFVDECLVGIGINVGENSLHGNELEQLKCNFFLQFDKNIKHLEILEKGITKRIYSRHYAKVFLNHLHYGYYKLAIKIIGKYIIYTPLNFIKDVLYAVVEYAKHKVSSKG
jgi:glycosyltransferase involved in cell wall biosynthesis